MSRKTSVTVRMGAAHWDVTIPTPAGDTVSFDLRTMDRNERGKFHGQFMAAFRRSQQQKGR